MKHVLTALALVVQLTTSIIHAQQVDTVMLGVYVSDMDNLHFFQMRDSLHLNSFELRTGLNPTRDAVLMNNAAGLKLINQRQFLRNMSTAQRMVYEAEKNDTSSEQLTQNLQSRESDIRACVPEHLKRFLIPATLQPDTIIYLNDMTIFFYDKDISRLKQLGIVP